MKVRVRFGACASSASINRSREAVRIAAARPVAWFGTTRAVRIRKATTFRPRPTTLYGLAEGRTCREYAKCS